MNCPLISHQARDVKLSTSHCIRSFQVVSLCFTVLIFRVMLRSTSPSRMTTGRRLWRPSEWLYCVWLAVLNWAKLLLSLSAFHPTTHRSGDLDFRNWRWFLNLLYILWDTFSRNRFMVHQDVNKFTSFRVHIKHYLKSLLYHNDSQIIPIIVYLPSTLHITLWKVRNINRHRIKR